MATPAELYYQRRAEAQAAAQQQAAEAAQAQAAAEARQQALARENNRTWGEALFQDLPLQLVGSAVGLGQAAYGVSNMGTGGLLDYGLGLSESFPRAQEVLLENQSPRTQAAVRRVSEGYDKGMVHGLSLIHI